jgi:hypothetical protein
MASSIAPTSGTVRSPSADCRDVRDFSVSAPAALSSAAGGPTELAGRPVQLAFTPGWRSGFHQVALQSGVPGRTPR